MQCIDRRIEISVFLLQPGELGFELTLVFIGHVCGGRKPIGVRLEAVDALWKLSSLRGVIASDLQAPLADLPQHISAGRRGVAQAH
ncbi:hypothetical protein CO669_10850 [Bradyrhizobium sp. Y36]|nr:hypothetical protein CO669_10850 [Bradyrhizobium sp. Y36]